jgi:conjugative relaxase-like TrwC/TraI family protein
VTARVTTLRGPDAGAYYVEQLGSYYLDGDEPPGRWHGRGAAELGLGGEIDEDAFLALMDGLDPTTGRALGSAHSERTVRGFDVTFSAPKSLSVLYAVGGEEVCDAVLAGHDAAVSAVIDWIEDHAHTRYRVNGQIHTVDAEGIVAVAFRQHVSRELDPQLHTHVVIPNRVLAPDGRWLALDAQTLKRDQRTLSALYHGGLRAEVTQRLGVRWETPENGIAEIADIPPQVLAAYSCRTREVRDRIDLKIERFTETFEREPTPRERWRLEREAVIDSRPSKASADAPTLAQEWTGRLVGLGIEPDTLLDRSLDRIDGHQRLDTATVDQVMSRAVEALSERQSTWRPAEVTREVAAALPTNLALPAHEVAAIADALLARIVGELLVDLSRPIEVGVQRRRDGRPVTESAMERALTTPDIVAQEHQLLERAERRLEAGGEDATTICERPGTDPEPTQNRPGDRDPDRVAELNGPQLEVAAAVAGTRQLVLVVGPAGTGKTTALQPAVEQLRTEGRTVFGVAPSAAAAEVLATDTGVDAETIDKLLVEYRLTRPPEHRYNLPPGATVIVDEAAMVSTPNLVELFALAEQRQWRLALVGDPLQFAAVGRAGMFGYLVDQFGATQLDQVHRFAEPWERDASLRLRRSDPAVVEDYDTHGRLHGGTSRQMTRQALDAWSEARAAGETVALMAPTREAVTILNQRAQHRRLEAGELDRYGTTLDVGDYQLREGDEIATRHNDRAVRTTHGHMVKNRDHWTIDTIHPDGDLTVTGRTGTVRLDADYVAEHVELGYAETSHATQGRTVDRSILYLDGPTNTRGIYVPLTRGRHTNDAYIALTGEQTPADVIAESLTRTWIDRPALEVHQELNPPDLDPDTGRGRSIHRSVPEVDERVDTPDVAALVQRAQDLTRTLRQVLTPDMRRHLEDRINDLERRHEQRSTELEQSEKRLAQARTYLDRHDGPIGRRLHWDALNAAHFTASQLPGTIDWTNRELTRLDQELHHARTDLDHRIVITRDAPDIRAELTDLRNALGPDLADGLSQLPPAARRSVDDLLDLAPILPDLTQAQQELELQRQRQRSIEPPSLGL